MRNRYLSLMGAASMIMAVSCMDENDLVQKPAAVASASTHQFVEGEVIVKFKAGISSAASRQASLLSVAQAQVLETIRSSEVTSGAGGRQSETGSLVLATSKLGTVEAIAQLKKLPEVEYAEPNFIYQHFDIPTDPYFANGSLWGMYGDKSTPANAYGSQAAEVWGQNTGSSSVYIGIIDEGYMYTHPDLQDNAGTNPGEVAGNGIDDDGNGYVDDVYGWDFDGRDNSVFDGVDDDHGTHVAGTIGARGNNGIGVAGVVWTVKLMNAKFLGKRGGTTANAVKAVDYFTDLKIRHSINVVATSNSWGGGGFSQALKDAIERANAADILFIAAAGNSSVDNDAAPHYPSSYSNANIISVASIDKTGALSGFSNWGSSSVDIGAPGSGIYSTVPRRSQGQVIAGYASYSGTSMATPHVSGAAALYVSLNPGASASTIKTAIMDAAEATGSLSGKCVTGGRLDVGKWVTGSVASTEPN